MVISYRIPNGHMRIEADIFFYQAKKPQIKRMFKQLQSSFPSQENLDEIRRWLKMQIEMIEKEMDDEKLQERYKGIAEVFDKIFSA